MNNTVNTSHLPTPVENAGPRGEVAASPRNFSSSHHPKTPASKNVALGGSRSCAGSVFRPDYQTKVRISKLEAADYAGVSPRTIEAWIYRRKNPLPRCAVRGAYIIDRLELEKYLRRGL